MLHFDWSELESWAIVLFCLVVVVGLGILIRSFYLLFKVDHIPGSH